MDRRSFLGALSTSVPIVGGIVSKALAPNPVGASDLVRITYQMYEEVKRDVRSTRPDFVPEYDETGLVDLNPGPKIRINTLKPIEQHFYEITVEDDYGGGKNQLPSVLKMRAREENGTLHVYITEESPFYRNLVPESSKVIMRQKGEDLEVITNTSSGTATNYHPHTPIPLEYHALANSVFKDWKAGQQKR